MPLTSQNSDFAQMQMLMGANQNNSPNMMSMLPYFMSLQKNQSNGNTKTPDNEFIKTMMMTNMMSDINSSLFSEDSNKY